MMMNLNAGQRLNKEEAGDWYQHAGLPELGQAAQAMRRSKQPAARVTYIIDRNINYTNVCICGCSFCAFQRGISAPDAYVLNQEVMEAKVREAVALGATQIMLQGGLHPALGIDYFERLFAALTEKYDVVLHSLSPPEIVHIAEISGLSVEETLRRLIAAGLHSLPGGGAEILEDRFRRRVSPNKITAGAWLEVMRQAHGLGIHSTATMVIGMGETMAERLDHLEAIRRLQDETGGFKAFIVWSYQPGADTMPAQPVSAVEYLRFLALSRLYLDNFDHIQASWLSQGKAVGQLALLLGADDMGSVMLEENVMRAAGHTYSMQVAEMEQLIAAAGFVPARRNTDYDVIE
jgi:cyclic dehypoxanthinyl futalosine synthase